MNSQTFLEYETCVTVDGEHLSLNNNPDIEFMDVEEDFSGKDLITFKYKGQTKKSFAIKRNRINL
jgi:hypothetical protein